jgi:hypothetical protein
VDTGDEGLENDDGWAAVKRLIELAKSEPPPPLSPERRRRIRQGLIARLERERVQRALRQFAIQ